MNFLVGVFNICMYLAIVFFGVIIFVWFLDEIFGAVETEVKEAHKTEVQKPVKRSDYIQGHIDGYNQQIAQKPFICDQYVQAGKDLGAKKADEYSAEWRALVGIKRNLAQERRAYDRQMEQHLKNPKIKGVSL